MHYDVYDFPYAFYCPIVPFTILVSENQEIGEIYVV